jgi:hypothetical protein
VATLTGFTDVGFISEEGITESESASSNNIKAWQGAAVVRKVQTEHDLTYKLTAMETSDAVIALRYGNGTAASYQIKGDVPGRKAFVIEVIDGDTIMRGVIPNGEITEKGDRVFASANTIQYPMTITAYPDESGVKAYWYKAVEGS